MLRSIGLTLGLLLPLATPAAPPDPLAARVVILANRDDPDSLRLARHYAEVRGVPAENIIGLPMPPRETISWDDFLGTVWQPLQDELIRRRWIEAIPMTPTDAVGRRRHVIEGHRLSYLVVCRGVPLRIDHDPARYRPRPPLTEAPAMRTNQAAVDSELTLLATNGSPINAFVENPLFRNDQPAAAVRSRVIKVSRLDGPTLEDAWALVDRAVAAERDGVIGRAYVDRGGPHPDGDAWLKATAAELRALHFDLDVDEMPATMPATARCDAPAFYFGWYAPDLNGPFALPGFRFPAGAVAMHIHSSSGLTLRSASAGWSGPLVARGVTATVANVFEPYLQLLHRPDLLVKALARGDRFGDAAFYAEPALSWQAIAIGDPLYRPLAVPLEQQRENRAGLAATASAYVTVREMQRLEAAGETAAAETLGRSALESAGALPLALALAQRDERAGRPKAAAAEFARLAWPDVFPADEWGLAESAAALLKRVGAFAAADEIERRLLSDPALPNELRTAWTPAAN